MNIFEALILGMIQGLTEFLPVSSSGHLEIGKVILGQNLVPEESMLMTVVLHGATALATMVVFHREIREIVTGAFRIEWNEHSQFVAKVVSSMIPAVIVGLAFEDQIENLFRSNMLLVGAMLLATGVLLLLAGRRKDTSKEVSFPRAFIIGIAQAIAILPGISRSGATIATSVLLGVDRFKAAKFSFLMVIPLILGKIAKDAKDMISGDMAIASPDLIPLIVGFVAAFLTGVAACKWMIALVRNFQLWWFSIYCFVVGAIALGYHFFIVGGSPR